MARNYLARSARYYRKHGYWASVALLGKKIKRGMGVSKGNAPSYMTRFSELLEDPDLSSSPTPAPELLPGAIVAVIGDLGLAQCKKYRVIQKLECLAHLGTHSNYSHWGDVPRCFGLLQMASTVILYRVQNTRQVQAYITEARRLGVRILYDIDDPIFDQNIYAQNPNLKFLSSKEMKQLLSGSPRYVEAIRQCDGVIVSTPGMRDVMAKHFSGNIYLWRNAIDAASALAGERAVSEKPPGVQDRVTIGYASGSRAHEADFRVVSDALLTILKKYPQTDLKILGHLELPDEFERFKDRISETPFTGYDAYFRALATFDISIIPLVQDNFNECKSAIRYLESSLVRVPTIVSSTGDFINIISSDNVGRIASNPEEWLSNLEELISRPDLRQRIAENAHDHVYETQTTAAVMNQIEAPLAQMLETLPRAA